MLPNLGGLAMKEPSTGVTVNPDGSVLLTPGEWAGISKLLAESVAVPSAGAAPAPAPMPAPAPAPASSRSRRPVRVNRDDNSSSEDERPLASRVPPPSKRRARSSRVRVAHDDDDDDDDGGGDGATVPLLNLSADDLSSILNAIGRVEESKATACQDAQNWCATSVAHGKACRDSDPQIWRDLAARIFDNGPGLDDKEVAWGKNLIYDTFRDDANPRNAFNSMCGATGLADVLTKRFVMFASEPYGELLWDVWADTRADVTGLGEAIEDLSGEEADKMAEEYYPDIFKADEWVADAKALFERAPPKALYLDKYRNDATFSKLVDNLFKGTTKYLFEDPRAINDMDNDANALDAFYMIGEVLGIYTVCLWKLERDRNAFEAKHSSDDDPMAADVLDTLLDEKDVFTQNLRTRIVYAIDLIVDATNATEITDYSDFNEFQNDLFEYDTDDAFDGGKDHLRD